MGPLLQNDQELQDGESRSLSQVLGPTKCGDLCDHTDHTPIKLVKSLILEICALTASWLETPICGSSVGHHAQLRNINGAVAPKPRKGGGCLLTESSRASNAPEIKEHNDRERFVIVVKEEALHSHLHDNT